MSFSEESLCRTERFHVVSLAGALPDGRALQKAVIRHPGAVVILPLVSDTEVCLIENFRPAVNQSLLELPAGTREPSESPLTTAQRELTEGNGVRRRRLGIASRVLRVAGILDERMFVFVARQLTPGPANRQPDESIQNRLMTIDDALVAIRQNEIEDAKTIAALLFWNTFRNR